MRREIEWLAEAVHISKRAEAASADTEVLVSKSEIISLSPRSDIIEMPYFVVENVKKARPRPKYTRM